jgi:membrane protease YdiL (CAAX protease family)
MGTSDIGGSSATIKSGDTLGDIPGQPASPMGGSRESIVVLMLVLAPIGLAILLVTAGLAVLAGSQMFRGVSVALPSRASLQPYGLLAYAAGSWIDVAVVWLWSSRRGWRGDIFLFRKLSWSALATSIMAFVLAVYGAPAMLHGLSQLTGGTGSGVRINFHDAQSVTIYLLLFVITAPMSEEILYRGLLVTWFRRLGWKDSAICLVGSLIFGANHVLPLGFAFAVVMVVFGGLLFALRLRYDSLSPSWLLHFLFNAQPFLIFPLIEWLAPALHPGYLT